MADRNVAAAYAYCRHYFSEPLVYATFTALHGTPLHASIVERPGSWAVR